MIVTFLLLLLLGVLVAVVAEAAGWSFFPTLLLAFLLSVIFLGVTGR